MPGKTAKEKYTPGPGTILKRLLGIRNELCSNYDSHRANLSDEWLQNCRSTCDSLIGSVGKDRENVSLRKTAWEFIKDWNHYMRKV